MMLRDLSFRRLLETMTIRRQWLLAIWVTAFLFLNCLSFTTLAREMVHLQEGLVESGLAVLRSGYVDQAKSIFESAIRRNPQDSRAYQGLGLAFIEQKNWSAAEENLRTARDLDPDNVTTRVYLGFVNAQQKSFEDAIRELEHAVQLAPDSADAHYALAAAYADGGQQAPALSHAEKAVALSPGHQPANRLLQHLRSLPENQKQQ
jgi:tetratricopeptide (TPR) repeat protein